MKTSTERWRSLRQTQNAYVRSIELAIAALERQRRTLEAEKTYIIEAQFTMMKFGPAVVEMQDRRLARIGLELENLAAEIGKKLTARRRQETRLKHIERLAETNAELERVELDQQRTAEIIDALQVGTSTSPAQG